MNEQAMNNFSRIMTEKLGSTYSLKWDIDKKGVVCGWCKLQSPDDIFTVAEIIAELKGRVMTISPLNTPSALVESVLGTASDNKPAEEKNIEVVVNYHFFFDGINCTATITLPDNQRTVKSITPILISADWHEREMQELYNIKLQGHPNSKRLFLDENIYLTDHTMIPLSEALNGASTNTLWEKLMKSEPNETSEKKGADIHE